MSAPRNVFIVCNNVDEAGGVQRVAHVLARGFAARGHRVELIGLTHAARRYPYEVDGYEVVTLYGDARLPRAPWRPRRPRDLLRLRRAAYEALVYRREFAASVRRLSARLRAVPDGVVICMQVWAMEWVARADTAHLRVVVQSHEDYAASRGLTPASEGSTRYLRMRRLYRDADAFLLLTEDDAERFRRDGFRNVGAMPNPLTRTAPEPAALDAPTVLNIGRYHPQKNQQALLEAWPLVVERHPGWRLKLFGEGELAADLRATVDRLGIVDSATIGGLTSNVVDELLGASVFALPSDFEGLPLVVLEAMSCGVPCVAFDCGPGVRELVHDGVDGIVVPRGDVRALAEGISRLIADPALRKAMGAAARVAVQRYDPDAVFAQWERLFDRLDAGAGPEQPDG